MLSMRPPGAMARSTAWSCDVLSCSRCSGLKGRDSLRVRPGTVSGCTVHVRQVGLSAFLSAPSPFGSKKDGREQAAQAQQSGGFEPPRTPRAQNKCLDIQFNLSGAERTRTADPLPARQMLSQLSYSPVFGFPLGRPLPAQARALPLS
jgi:hypothetical protein